MIFKLHFPQSGGITITNIRANFSKKSLEKINQSKHVIHF